MIYNIEVIGLVQCDDGKLNLRECSLVDSNSSPSTGFLLHVFREITLVDYSKVRQKL